MSEGCLNPNVFSASIASYKFAKQDSIAAVPFTFNDDESVSKSSASQHRIHEQFYHETIKELIPAMDGFVQWNDAREENVFAYTSMFSFPDKKSNDRSSSVWEHHAQDFAKIVHNLETFIISTDEEGTYSKQMLLFLLGYDDIPLRHFFSILELFSNDYLSAIERGKQTNTDFNTSSRKGNNRTATCATPSCEKDFLSYIRAKIGKAPHASDDQTKLHLIESLASTLLRLIKFSDMLVLINERLILIEDSFNIYNGHYSFHNILSDLWLVSRYITRQQVKNKSYKKISLSDSSKSVFPFDSEVLYKLSEGFNSGGYFSPYVRRLFQQSMEFFGYDDHSHYWSQDILVKLDLDPIINHNAFLYDTLIKSPSIIYYLDILADLTRMLETVKNKIDYPQEINLKLLILFFTILKFFRFKPHDDIHLEVNEASKLLLQYMTSSNENLWNDLNYLEFLCTIADYDNSNEDIVEKQSMMKNRLFSDVNEDRKSNDEGGNNNDLTKANIIDHSYCFSTTINEIFFKQTKKLLEAHETYMEALGFHDFEQRRNNSYLSDRFNHPSQEDYHDELFYFKYPIITISDMLSWKESALAISLEADRLPLSEKTAWDTFMNSK